MSYKEIRNFTKLMTPTGDFDSAFTFYYDETNNIKKFLVNEEDFNVSFSSNFVLGGLVCDTPPTDLTQLFEGLKLQKTTNELKFKHIAKGEFLDCLKSDKLNFFLQYVFDSNLYIHYSTVNILFYSLVDIVDSAIANSEIAQKNDLTFSRHLKNDVYKLAKLEIDSVIELFRAYGYPNIKSDSVSSFISAFTSLFSGYIDTQEFHFGLVSLRQILKESNKKNSLPFIQDEEDFILINDLSQFYLRPLYLFTNSNHIFDNELDIANSLNAMKELDNENELTNSFSFVDSTSNQLIQVSDVFIGLIGKLSTFINTTSTEDIEPTLATLSQKQLSNLFLLFDIIDKSIDRNIAFVHSVDCFEELNKLNIIRQFKLKMQS